MSLNNPTPSQPNVNVTSNTSPLNGNPAISTVSLNPQTPINSAPIGGKGSIQTKVAPAPAPVQPKIDLGGLQFKTRPPEEGLLPNTPNREQVVADRRIANIEEFLKQIGNNDKQG